MASRSCSCTCGSRTTEVLTPRVVNSFTAASEAARGFHEAVAPSSVDGLPSTLAAIAVPEVTTNGRFEPSSTSPIASIALRSSSQFFWNCEKSWLKAK